MITIEHIRYDRFKKFSRVAEVYDFLEQVERARIRYSLVGALESLQQDEQAKFYLYSGRAQTEAIYRGVELDKVGYLIRRCVDNSEMGVIDLLMKFDGVAGYSREEVEYCLILNDGEADLQRNLHRAFVIMALSELAKLWDDLYPKMAGKEAKELAEQKQ